METNNNETKLRRVIFNEGTFVLAIVGATVAFIAYFANPSTQNTQDLRLLEQKVTVVNEKIQNIKDNDLNEIQLSLERIEQLQIQLGKDVVRLQTLLEKR